VLQETVAVAEKFHLNFNLQNANTTCYCTLENYRYRHAMQSSQMQHSEVWYLRSDEFSSRSRVPGENCIDNITIAWMATVNLSPSYDTLARRERQPVHLRLRSIVQNSRSIALNTFATPTTKVPFITKHFWVIAPGYGLNKLLRIHALC